MDPYTLTPLGADPVSLAGLQARALLDAGKITEREMAEIVVRSRRNAKSNPHAQVKGSPDVDVLLKEPYFTAPLRKHDLPPISDGATAVVLATADKARAICERPVWIRGIDHRIEIHQPGLRDLTRLDVDRRSRPRAPASATRRSRSPSCRRPSRTRRRSCATRSGSATASTSTRRVARSPRTR